MTTAWTDSWVWGLLLSAVTTALHALGVVFIFHGLRRTQQRVRVRGGQVRYPVLFATLLIGIVGLLLSVLHGFEAWVWAEAYLGLGAIDSQRAAVLYSLDSFTTRGASGLTLSADWRLMGALEAANGMLLFGISTAFVFTVLERIVVLTGHREEHHMQDGEHR